MGQEPTFIIFGAEGVLGKAFISRLSSPAATEYRVFPFNHAKADITNSSHIGPLMEYIRPDIVINCAAVSDQDICEKAKDGATLVNATGPVILAENCKKYEAVLIHFSTVSVFDGKKKSPYTEHSPTNPINIYSKTKLGGEQLVRKRLPHNHLIIRPGFLFGLDEPNCISSWISMTEKKQKITVSQNHICPTYAPDLAEATLELIFKGATGVYHIANSGYTTHEEFVRTTLNLCNLNEESIKVEQSSTPENTTLATKKYEKTVKKHIRSWEDALKHCLFTMQRYSPK